MGGVSRKKRIVGNGRTRATKSCELLASSSSRYYCRRLESTLWIPNVFPTHWTRTTAKLLSWNCLPCTGNPCSSNLMKLRELCVIKVARGAEWKPGRNSRPWQTVETGRRRMRVLEIITDKYYRSWTCIYICQQNIWLLINQNQRSFRSLLNYITVKKYSVIFETCSIERTARRRNGGRGGEKVRRKLTLNLPRETMAEIRSPGPRWRARDLLIDATYVKGLASLNSLCPATPNKNIDLACLLLGFLYVGGTRLALRKTVAPEICLRHRTGDVDLKRDTRSLPRRPASTCVHPSHEVFPPRISTSRMIFPRSSSRQRKSLSLPRV